MAVSVALASMAAAADIDPQTLPAGAVVNRGSASINVTAGEMNVLQSSDRAVIDWTSFDVGELARVRFQQPSLSSAVLNRVTTPDPSQIFGQIESNGQVFLSNPSGIVFGPSSRLDVGSLVATTMDIDNDDFMAGDLRFQRSDGDGRVVNQGQIHAALGGYVALLAPEVINDGLIVAREGSVVMAAGEHIELQFDGQSLSSLRVEPSLIDSLIDNRSAVRADGGLIILSARAQNAILGGVVRHSGELDATSLTEVGGRVLLTGDDIRLSAGSSIDASGAAGGDVLVGGDWQGGDNAERRVFDDPDAVYQATTVVMEPGARIDASATTAGDGGTVVLWSDITAADSETQVQGRIRASGAGAGHGGQVETSGRVLGVAGAQVDTGHGDWLLDPGDIFIRSDGTAGVSNGSDVSAQTIISPATLESALVLNNVTLQTGAGNYDITVNDAVSYSGSNSLTLIAGAHMRLYADISVGGGIRLESAYDLNLHSGVDLTAAGAGAEIQLRAGRHIMARADGWALETGADGAVGGDITLYADVDSATAAGGSVDLRYNGVIDTHGGDLIIAGGDDAGSGFAQGESDQARWEGIRFSGLTLTTAGGDVVMRGKSIASASVPVANGAWGVGIDADSAVSIDAGAGQIDITGISQAASDIGFAQGILLDAGSQTISLSSSYSGDGAAISLTGSSVHNGANNIGIKASSPVTMVSTGANGGIVLDGDSAGSGGIAFTSGGEILSAGGDIQLLSANLVSGSHHRTLDSNGGTLYLGSKAGSDVTASSADLTVEFNTYSWGSYDPQVATTGAFTWAPAGDSFSHATVKNHWFSVNQNGHTLGGFVFGSASNQSNLTMDSAVTADGPVSVLGATVTLDNSIDTTGAASGSGDILLSASTLVRNDDVSLGDGGVLTLDLVNDHTFTQVIAGTNVGLTKLGTGTLTLGQSNTYTGTTTISEGVVIATHQNALGANSGTTRVDDGARLVLDGVAASSENFQLAGTGGNSTGALVSDGTLTLNGSLDVIGTTAIVVSNTDTADTELDLTLTGDVTSALDSAASLTLQAERNLSFGNDVDISASGSGALTLNFLADTTGSGDGIIVFNGDINDLKAGDINFGDGTTATIGGTAGVLVGGDLYVSGASAQTINSGGGDITFNGELILANAGGLTLGSANGDIRFKGVLNSGNAYQYVATSSDTGSANWDSARTSARHDDNSDGDYNDINDRYMVTITSRLENSLASLAANYTGSWIGAWRPSNGTSWQWADGPDAGAELGTQSGSTFTASSTRYTNFGPGEPNGSGTGESRGQFFGTAGAWNDLQNAWSNSAGSVYNVLGYVTETNLAPSPLTIAAGTGDVTFDKTLGGSKALSNVAITARAVSFDASAVVDSTGMTLTTTDGVAVAGGLSGDGALTTLGAGNLVVGVNDDNVGRAVNLDITAAAGVSVYAENLVVGGVWNSAAGTDIVVDIESDGSTTVSDNWTLSRGLNLSGGSLALTADLISTDTSTGDLALTVTSLTGSGNLTIAGGRQLSVTNTSDSVYGGVISGSLSTFTKSGSATLTVTGAHTYTGATTISAGTLQLGNGGTAGSLATSNVVNNAALRISRSDDSAHTFDISGSGTLELVGVERTLASVQLSTTAQTLASNTTVEEVMARLSSVTRSGGNDATGQQTGLYFKRYDPATNTATMQSQFYDGSFTKVVFVKLAQSGSDVTVAAYQGNGSRYTLYKNGDSLGQDMRTTDSPGSLNGGNPSAGDTSDGYGIKAFSIGSAYTLSTSNTFTGTTTIGATTIDTPIGGGAPSDSDVETARIVPATLNFVDGIVGSGAIDVNGLLKVDHASAQTLSAALSGGGYVLKQGAGALTVSGTNTFAGTTSIANGTWVLDASDAFNTSAGRLVFGADSTLQYTANSTALDVAARVAADITHTARVDTAGHNVTWGSVLDGESTSLTKVGSGTLTLSSANYFSGPTDVEAGTLSVTGSLYDSPSFANRVEAVVTVSTGAVLEVEDLSWEGAFGILYFSADNIVLDGGTLRLTTSDTVSSGRSFTVTANGGTIDVPDPEASVTVSTAIGSEADYRSLIPGPLTVSGAGDLTMHAQLTGAATLTKNGTGTLTLARPSSNAVGANTFSGGTVVNAGRLVLDTSNALGSGSATVMDGGALGVTGVAPTNTLSLAGTGVSSSGALYSTSSSAAGWAGAITLSADSAIKSEAGGALNLSGTLNGAHVLTVDTDGATDGALTVSNTIGASASPTALTLRSGLASTTLSATAKVSGDISLVAGAITVSADIDTRGATGGDLLLKSAGDIVLNQAELTTDGGGVRLWANSDGGQSNGSVLLYNGSNIETSGGHVWMGGGSQETTWNGMTVGDGYAVEGTTVNPIAGGAFESAIYLERATVTSGGGDVLMRARNYGSASSDRGWSNLGSTTIDAGAGQIEIDVVTNAPFGIVTGMHNGQGGAAAANLVLRSSHDVEGASAIVISVDSSASGANNMATIVEGTTSLIASGRAGILIDSSAASGAIGLGLGYQTTSSGTLNVLSSSGQIELNTGNSSIASPNTSSRMYVGAKAGTSVLASTADVSILGDVISILSPVDIASSGRIVVAPIGASFTSGLIWPISSNLTLPATLGGLTLGKVGNQSSITVNTAISTDGDVEIYGGDIVINAAVTATTGKVTVSGAGTVVDGANGYIVANGLALLDGAVTLDHASNNVVTLAASGLDSLSFKDSNALTVGSVNPDGIAASGAVSITSGGDLTVSNAISGGAVTLIADGILDINAAVNAGAGITDLRFDSLAVSPQVTSTGTVRLSPHDASTDVTVGATGDGWRVSHNSLADFSAASSLVVGYANTASLTLDGFSALVTDTTFNSAGDLRLTDASAWSSADSLTLVAGDDLYVDQSLTMSGDSATLNLTYADDFEISLANRATITLSADSPAVNINSASYSVLDSKADLDTNLLAGGRYVMAGDIDVGSETKTAAYKDLTFTGTLEGFGHDVKNLTINAGSGQLGFFKALDGASVRHLGFTDVDIRSNFTGNLKFGALTGQILGDGDTTLAGLHVSGSLATAKDASSASTVSLAGGGLVGMISSTGSTTLSRSFGTATVSSQGANVLGLALGGLIGDVGNGTLSSLAAAGYSDGVLVERVFTTGTVIAGDYDSYFGTGGIIGVAWYSDRNFTLRDSFSHSRVSTNGGTGVSVGGLYGAMFNPIVERVYTTQAAYTVGAGAGGLLGNDAQTPTDESVGVTSATSLATLNLTDADVWAKRAGRKAHLVDLPVPQLPIYVQVKDGQSVTYGDLSNTYSLLDESGSAINFATSVVYTDVAVDDPGSESLRYTIGSRPDASATPYTNVSYLGGLTLTGADALDYVLIPDADSGSITVAKKALTLSASGAAKVYDGTTNAAVSTSDLAGVLDGDTVTAGTPTASYASADVSGSVSITVSNLALGGADAGNYSLPSTLSTTGAITARPITLTVADQSRVYGDSLDVSALVYADNVSLTGGSTAAGESVTGVTLASANGHATAITRDVGTSSNEIVASSATGAGGFTASNYSITYANGSLAVTAAPLTLTANDESKIYGDAAVLAGTAFAASGLKNGETVGSVGLASSGAAVTGVVGTYDIVPSAATGGTFTANNYSISYANGSLAVTKRALTHSGFVAANRVYNATNTATVTSAGTFGNLVNSDTVGFTDTGATFDSAHAGTRTATLNGIALTGADRTNYSFASAVTDTATITPKALSLAASRSYDGTTDLTGDIAITGTVGAQTLTYSGATASDAHVATGSKYVSAITLGDGSGLASNYQLPDLTAAGADNAVTLTTRTVGLDLNDTGVTRAYDATTNAPAAFAPTFTLTNLAGGDTDLTLGYTGASYDNANAGTRTLTLSGLNIAAVIGNNLSTADDYQLAVSSDSVAATITPAPLTVTANDAARFVVESENTAYAGVTYAGFVGGEGAGDLTDSASVTRTNPSELNADTYSGVLQPRGVSSNNYAITFAPGDYRIVPSDELLIDVQSVTNTYGTATSYSINRVAYENGGTVYRLDNNSISGSSVSVVSNRVSVDDGNGGTAAFTLAPVGAVTSTSGAVDVGSYQLGAADAVISGGGNFNDTLNLSGAHQVNALGIAATPSTVTKVYDGTDLMTGLTLGLSGQRSDDLVAAAGVGAFGQSNQGTGVAYLVSNLALSGADADNYYLTGGASLAGSNGVISRRALDLTFSADDKVFDATDAADGRVVMNNRVTGDAVTVSYNEAFADLNVGSGKQVNFTSIAISGADADNYSVATSAAATASITPATVTSISANKVYDGTLDLTGASWSIAGVSGETLSIDIAQTATANDVHVATAGKYVTALTLADGTGRASNYVLPTLDASASTVTVTPKSLTASLTNTGVSKVYDGTTAAPAGFLPAYSVSGLIAGDSAASLNQSGLAYDSADVAGASTLTASGLTIAGITGLSNVSDYSLSATTAAASAGITPATLTVTANDDARFVVSSDASNFLGARYHGFVPNEGLSDLGGSLAVTRPGASTDTIAGTYAGALEPRGLTSSNYDITFAPGDYTIVGSDGMLVRMTPVTTTYAGAATYVIDSVAYLDGSTETQIYANGAGIGGADASVSGNRVTVTDGAGGSAAFDVGAASPGTSSAGHLKVGDYDLALSGSVLDNSVNFNNSVTLIGAHQVNAKTLVAAVSAGQGKVYDGSITMLGLGFGLTGVETDDSVTASGAGQYDSKRVSANRAYAATLSIAGTDANNYVLASAALSGTGAITQRTLTLTASALDKVYDGNAIATASLSDNRVTDDQVTFTFDATFADKNVAANKAVTVANIQLSGADAGNYSALASAATTAAVTRLNQVQWTGLGGDDNWFNPANWAGGAVPDLSNVANVVLPTGTQVTFGRDPVSPAQSGPVNLDSIGQGGALTQIAGTLNVGAGGVALDSLTQSGGVLDTTGGLSVAGGFNQTGTGTLTVGGDADITGAGGIVLGNLAVAGGLALNSTDGPVTQTATGVLSVPGTTTVSATGQNVTLANAGNDFGTISVNARDLTLNDSAPNLTLDQVVLSGGLTLTNTGDVEQLEDSVLNVAGPARIDSTGAVNLTSPRTQFRGGVTATGTSLILGPSGAADATLAAMVRGPVQALPPASAQRVASPVARAVAPVAAVVVEAVSLPANNSRGLMVVTIPTAQIDLAFDVPAAFVELMPVDRPVTASLVDGSALPDWLIFDATQMRFRPSTIPAGALPLTVAVQAGGMAFEMVIVEAADDGEIDEALTPLQQTQGFSLIRPTAAR